tara:strand:- start:46 stop:429 length:384 start_codon:yes stop_codon:yes gene_type:complete
MNWNTLLLFDFNNNKIDRKNSVQQAYNNEKQKIKNYSKFILNTYLDNKLYNLQPNKFPYNLNNNIKHYVLWLHPMLDLKYITNKKLINSILKKYIPNNEYIFYMNSYNNRSIKQIPHYQVFIKTISK